MDLAVGQGDLLTDPLQMAVAYSTLANAYSNGGEGTVVTPHLGKQIDEAQRRPRAEPQLPAEAPRAPQRLRPQPRDGRDPRGRERARRHLRRRLDGLEPGRSTRSTARPAPPSTPGQEDQSWYMCYIADPKRPIVIAVTVEAGRLRRRNRRADRPPDGLPVVRRAREVRRRELEDAAEPLSPITARPEEAPARRAAARGCACRSTRC